MLVLMMELKPNEKLYIHLIQDEIKNTLDAGLITDASKQYIFIEQQLHKLIVLNNQKINEKIKNYFEVQQEVKEKVKDLQKQLQDLSDLYHKNATHMYEEIKKL